MNKEKVVSFTGSILIFFILLFVYSKWGPSLPITVSTQAKGEPFVVMGEGKVVVVPDVAKIAVGIEQQGNTLLSVQNEVNRKSQELTKELKRVGIDEGNIKTISYNVYPEYDWENPARRIVGYRVSTSYQITAEEFEKVNDVITAATQVGANMVGNISFEVNDKTKKEKLQEARKIAVEAAKEKAKGLASASGITLGKIINISESQEQNFPSPLALTEKSIGTQQDGAVQPDIAPGETEIVVTINLYYEVR